MRPKTIFRILGLIIIIFSLSMLPPIGVALWYQEDSWLFFLIPFLITFGTGFLLWFPLRKYAAELKVRDGFLVVVLFWSVLSLFAALPFILSLQPTISVTDAVFESVSGLTTTGASVFYQIDFLPRAILYYRQQLQFLGGMGIVVLAVAILPMLGIGGLQLYRVEMPGPTKDHKLTPRIAGTAKVLWAIYVGLTCCCALAYWASGMPLFNAIGESFGTVATGGFSMHSDSFAYYNSALIDSVGIVFMVLGGTNFSLHFLALQQRSLLGYWRDHEFRVYIRILLLAILVSMAVLLAYSVYNNPGTAFIKAAFNVVSLATTTGYVSTSFQSWPTFLPMLLMLLAIMGGCAASTTGGLKVLRVLLLYRQGIREIHRLIHPRAVFKVKLGNQSLSEEVVEAIWGYISIFIAVFIALLLLLMAVGMNLETAVGALVACLANAGAGIGAISGSFSGLSDVSKWILTFAMIAGRLEIFTILVLFSPAFWRK